MRVLRIMAYLVHLEIVHLLNSLGRHVIDRADLLIPLNIDGIVRYGLGDPKVDNL